MAQNKYIELQKLYEQFLEPSSSYHIVLYQPEDRTDFINPSKIPITKFMDRKIFNLYKIREKEYLELEKEYENYVINYETKKIRLDGFFDPFFHREMKGYMYQNFNIRSRFNSRWRMMYELCNKFRIVPRQEKVSALISCLETEDELRALNYFIQTRTQVQDFDWIFSTTNEDIDINSSRNVHLEKFSMKEKITFLRNQFPDLNIIYENCLILDSYIITREKIISLFVSLFCLAEDGNYIISGGNILAPMIMSIFFVFTYTFRDVLFYIPFDPSENYKIICKRFQREKFRNIYEGIFEVLDSPKVKNISDVSLFDQRTINKHKDFFVMLTKLAIKILEIKAEKLQLKISILEPFENERLIMGLFDRQKLMYYQSYIRKYKFNKIDDMKALL